MPELSPIFYPTLFVNPTASGKFELSYLDRLGKVHIVDIYRHRRFADQAIQIAMALRAHRLNHIQAGKNQL